MGALDHESDLTAAIISSSLLESTLERVIIGHLRDSSPRLLGQLFENRGPLSDFNGKILCAVAFGVISPAAGEHFQAIRHIRNAFAHSRTQISFETPQVRKEIDEFGMLKAMQAVSDKFEKDSGSEAPDMRKLPGKAAFLLIITILLIMLDDQHRRRGGQPLYEPFDQQTAST